MADETSQNPDRLLAAIQAQAARQGRGRLKVFLGMCPGVGKTYAMLEAGQREHKMDRDVIIGYVETHGRVETASLMRGLPGIPRRRVEHRGVGLEECDLDAVLERRPQLALVDELAHTNAPGSRHPKRWQDVQELRDAGIDVFTTLNVQHVESRADTVRQIAGVEVRETVPDSVLDDAVLELVDLPPAELIQRLREGKVYLPDRVAAAAQNFFREANLSALRELALRLVADHVGEDTQEFRRAGTRSESEAGTWKTGHRLLVAVGPSPTSESLVRWTRRMSDGLKCPWLAVHVEGPRPLTESAEARLTRNLSAARELGAEVITTPDADLARGLLRVARDRSVTQIVIGKPVWSRRWDWWQAGHLLRRLARESGEIDLHVVRAEKARDEPSPQREAPVRSSNAGPYLTAAGTVVAVGLFNLVFDELAGPRVPGLVFLLAVVVLALFVGRGPVLLAGALSALAWNFFFLPPRFTMEIGQLEDAVLFGTYFVVAVVLGQLVARIREQAEAERRREERATALYELTRNLAEAGSRDEVVWQLVAQVGRVFHASATVAIPIQDRLTPHPDGTLSLTEKELSVADWAFRNRQASGRSTNNLPAATALHLPLATERRTFGVLSLGLSEARLTLAQRELLETFTSQAALVLDRFELRRTAEQARWLAESERLGRTLLNSISHELRTPVTAINSAVSALAGAEAPDPELRGKLLGEIQEANARLDRVVGNLLDVSRLESGQVRPRLDCQDIRDLVQTTVAGLHRELSQHPVRISLPDGALLARADFSLLQQALSNLLLNSATHTPPGTSIDIRAMAEGDGIAVTVTDRGPGLPADLLPRVFDKFVRGDGAPAGGSGLGLAIVKGFVEAQGGRVTAENQPGGGAAFRIWISRSDAPPSAPSKHER